jgi:site-specific DNA-cytosine methylase
MSYTYLQEQGGASSAGCFSDIPQSVLLNLNLIAEKSYCKGSETESYQGSQSGTMSPPSTENLGADSLMLCAVVSPAKTYQVQGGGGGLNGNKSGLWAEMARIIGEIQPKHIFVENSPMLTVRGIGRVLGDISSMGYDARWGVIGADFSGYDHRRERLWIVANANSNRLEGRNYIETKRQWQTKVRSMAGLCETKIRNDIPAPDAFGAANGLPSRMDRLKAIGNGQVPLVAATAFRILSV